MMGLATSPLATHARVIHRRLQAAAATTAEDAVSHATHHLQAAELLAAIAVMAVAGIAAAAETPAAATKAAVAIKAVAEENPTATVAAKRLGGSSGLRPRHT